MRNKLRAILKIINSEYYMVITASGSVTACLPKDLKNITLMQEISKNLSEKIDKD